MIDVGQRPRHVYRADDWVHHERRTAVRLVRFQTVQNQEILRSRSHAGPETRDQNCGPVLGISLEGLVLALIASTLDIVSRKCCPVLVLGWAKNLAFFKYTSADSGLYFLFRASLQVAHRSQSWH